MSKVFLYLYPIEEYTKMFLFINEDNYDKWNIKKPLPILNETIEKRYRSKGFKVVYALFPDKELYGIDKKEEDKIIYTDVLFNDVSFIDENHNVKKDFIPTYPNEEYLINQLGNVDELVIGGYHAQDCVKKVGTKALEMGINTLVDLDLTDLFFSLYKDEEYYDISCYSPMKYKDYVLKGKYVDSFTNHLFSETYESKIFGFNK